MSKSYLRFTLKAGEPGLSRKAGFFGIDVSTFEQQQEVTFVADVEIKDVKHEGGGEEMKTRFG